MSSRNQIVITHMKEKLVFIYMQKDKIFDIVAEEEKKEDSVAVGDIYLGRVQNIVQNIDAVFVEVKKGVLCYLPLAECRDRDQALKCSDEIVVQIKKAAVKTKQAVATRYPELVGRYVVVSAKNMDKGISKKIISETSRKNLYELLSLYEEEPYGIVLRTNAEQAKTSEIKEECDALLLELHKVMKISESRTAFSLLHKEDDFLINQIYNYHSGEYDRIITDDKKIYEKLASAFGDVVQYYEDFSYSLDNLLGLSVKLQKALEKRVWLKSGGYLVIEPTEALTVIDVNTGKAIDGKRSKETTFFKINCEAAVEATRQLRMRNISGIILIDFIDMQDKEHKKELMKLLREELRKDKVRASLIDITKLGLVEITRMKKNKPLWEMLV